jgi:predicted hotdog family 3-hydroxylacyl-ACP dehydratase
MNVDRRIFPDVKVGIADQAVGVFVGFVGTVAENSDNPKIVPTGFFFGFKKFIVLDQVVDAADAEKWR